MITWIQIDHSHLSLPDDSPKHTEHLSCSLKGKWWDSTSSDWLLILFVGWEGLLNDDVTRFFRHIWNRFETFPFTDLFELSFNPELFPILRSSASFSKWNCGRMIIKEDSHISAWGQLSHEPSSTHKHTKKKNNSKASSFSYM